MSRKKWVKKTKQCIALKKFIDEDKRHDSEKEVIEETILPNLTQQWNVDVVRMGIKSTSPAKDTVSALENFENYERKFDIYENDNHRKPTTTTIATMTGKIRAKVKKCADSMRTIKNGNIST